MKSFTLTTSFPVSAERIYNAWLNSEKHELMTGGAASATDKEGGAFIAWDGYISGKNLTLVPNEKMVFAWRTTDFDDKDMDSKVEITLKETEEGCELSIVHTNIPDDGADYEEGWATYYFEPMREYFS